MRGPSCKATADGVAARATTSLGLLFGIVCLLWGRQAGALGVGELRTQSALNQPFYGEIRLFDVGEAGLDNVKASLASRSAFEQAGIERSHALTRLEFTPMIGPQGEPIIQVVTREPIREPYLDMLVEVVWSDGRLLKEYAVLLDPPALGGALNARVSQPRQGLPQRSPQTRPSPFVQAAEAGSGRSGPTDQQTASSPPPPRALSPAERSIEATVQVPASVSDIRFPLRFGPVPPGAGLTRIARQIAPPGATVEQTALALYRNNQQAFLGGDINRLRLGAELSIPSAAELFVLGPEAARRAYRAALAGREVARAPLTDRDVELRIMTPDDQDRAEGGGERTAEVVTADGSASTDEPDGPPTGLTSTGSRDAAGLETEVLLVREVSEANRQEAAELRERIRALEARLDDIQRLLELRNQQLAQLAFAGAASQGAGLDVDANELDADTIAAEVAAEEADAAADEAEAAADEADAAADEATGAAENGATPSIPPSELAEAATDPNPQDRSFEGRSEAAATVEAAPSERAPETDPAALAAETESTPQATASNAARAVSQQQSETESPARMTGWLDSLPAWAMPAAGGAAVLALLGLLVQRRRQQARLAVMPAAEEEAGAREGIPQREPDAQHPEPEHLTSKPLPNALVAGPLSDTEPSKTAAAETVAVVPTPEDPTPEYPAPEYPATQGQEPLDRLAEADIYLGYGRYRDAEHVLKEAAAEQPSARLRFKLAEVYRAAKDQQALASLAEEMRAAGDPEVDRERWSQIEAAIGAAGTDAVAEDELALTLDGLPEPTSAAAQAPEPVAQDSVPSATDTEEVSVPQVATEPDPEVAQEAARDAEPDDLFLELDDLGDLEDGAGTVPDQAEALRETASSSDETVLEALPVSEVLEDPLSDQAPGDAELTDRERLELDLAALGDLMAEPAVTGAANSAAADPAAAKKGDDQSERDDSLELPTLSDLPDEAAVLKPTLAPTSAHESFEPVLDQPTESGRGQAAEARVTADKEGSWPLESEDWDEGALKLDLARAYLDMGDSEAAATILNEVVAEGREDQRQEAGALLARLGADGASA